MAFLTCFEVLSWNFFEDRGKSHSQVSGEQTDIRIWYIKQYLAIGPCSLLNQINPVGLHIFKHYLMKSTNYEHNTVVSTQGLS
jgi:hypothetical protein